LNTSVKNTGLPGNIFTVTNENFTALALEVFLFQYSNNPLYRLYCDTLKVNPAAVNCLESIPYLPITFFKTHQVVSSEFIAEAIFESSGTSNTINSKHYVREVAIYQQSFNLAFRRFYGEPGNWCILALLPSYLERNSSSLVLMADQLIQQTRHPLSGFYLNDLDRLQQTLLELENRGQSTLLIGVTFALLDFAEQFPMPLQHTLLMETGGMKGRREEITRQQVHDILCHRFQLKEVHSEYSMTELLSQAYAKANGLYRCPPWMKILVREEDDPFAITGADANRIVTGAANIVDLANLYSCSFIATDDAAKIHPGNCFEILGRLDYSDTRGCSLLSL